MRRPQHGFTLLEMVLALVMLASLAALGGLTLGHGVSAYAAAADASAALAQQRYALERMVRELRQVAYVAGQYSFAVMAASSVIFTKNDGTQVSLTLNGSQLQIGYGGVAGMYTLADHVAGVVFSYYQADGVTQPATAVNAAFVDVELAISHGGGTTPMRTRVGLRI